MQNDALWLTLELPNPDTGWITLTIFGDKYTIKNNVSNYRVAVLSVEKRFTAYLVIKYCLHSLR